MKGGADMAAKKTWYRRRDEGLCVICGQPLPIPWEYVKCPSCLALKQTHPRPNGVEKAMTTTNKALDKMAREAHRRGISYGRLQSEETIDRIRYADKTEMTLKQWGRQVKFI